MQGEASRAPDLAVLLVGLMAVGKTTVGVPLGAALGCPYLDNDELVRRATGAALEELKQEVGGDGLHEAEVAALQEALRTTPPFVAAIAAWVVVRPEQRRRLIESGAYVVWLRATPETLARRVGTGGDRPWLRPDPLTVLRQMAAERSAFYAEVADLVVDVDHEDAGQVVGEIVDGLHAAGRLPDPR